MRFGRHLLLATLLTAVCFSVSGAVQAGSVTGKSLSGVTPQTVAVLKYIAEQVDHNITVTSAYRSPTYNANVGGASNSQHTRGRAIDISTSGLTDTQRIHLVRVILAHPSVKGFGFYTDSQAIHFDTRPAKTGKGYWGGSGGNKYSFRGFDAAARAGTIHPMIVDLVYRWSKTGSVGLVATDLLEKALKPLDQTTSVQQTPTLNPSQTQQPGVQIPIPPIIPGGTPSTITLPNNPATQVIGSVLQQAYPQYPLPGATPSALSSTLSPGSVTQPSVVPTPSVKQCSADRTPANSKKIPTMSASEWDRAVRILYAEAGSCKQGSNDTNCIKMAETFRNRLIAGMERGLSCWDTWDEILRFTGVKCGYFQANPGVSNAQRLEGGGKTYKNVEEALFQAVYGGTNLSLGNLHNFTVGYMTSEVNRSSIVPAGGDYTYIKNNESRVDISPYHFPNCANVAPEKPQTSQPTPQQPQQPLQQQQPQQPVQINPVKVPAAQPQIHTNPGFAGAGQNVVRTALPYTPPQTVTSVQTPAQTVPQVAAHQQQLVTQQTALRQQQQQLIRQQAERPDQQAEIRKQLNTVERQQKDLLQQQLRTLGNEHKLVQKKPSGNRTVTVIAAPTMDTQGVILTSLAGKLQSAGQDVIMMPDAANYQVQLDKVIAEIQALPENTKVNCVGWTKGALGCVALAKQLEASGRKLNNLVLIDPNDGIDGSSVPGVTAAAFARNEITVAVDGKVILYVPEEGSSLLVFEPNSAEAINVDELHRIDSELGHLSLGLEPALHSQIVSQLTGESTGTGSVYNVNLSAIETTKTNFGMAGILYTLRLSRPETPIPSPIIIWHWIGHGIGSFFGSPSEADTTVLSSGELNRDIYLLLVQDTLFTESESESRADSDITITPLKATKTLSDQYRFFASIKRQFINGFDGLGSTENYLDASITNELLIDKKCDGSVDEGVTFLTPQHLVLPSADGAEVIVSEYLPIEEDGLHCFAFVTDTDDVIEETNEDNNISEWREFVAGFNATVDTPEDELPSLNFEVSVYSTDSSEVIQEWTSENVTMTFGQQLAFRWHAPEYDRCAPLLSATDTDFLDNTNPANRNTVTERVDLEERTGYYEIRCEVGGDVKTEALHVTVN